MRIVHRSLKVLWCLLALATGPAARVANARPVTMIAGGDLMLARGVARQIARHGGDVDWPLARVRPLLQRADLAFANLECPLSSRAVPVRKMVAFRADPATALGLRRAGFDWLGLANNHSGDCGPIGLLETMQTLRAVRIGWCGAGANEAAAGAPRFQTVRGLRFAWLAFSEFPPAILAADAVPATIALASDTAIRTAVTAARDKADIVIVSFHWGIEFQTRPTMRQIEWARLAARCGADAVLGAHPHVLQGLEIARHGRRRTLIAYSLGNLVFDAPRAGDRRARETTLLRCSFTRAGVQSARLLPLVIENSRPRPALPAEAGRILGDVAGLSAERGVTVRDGLIQF